MPSRRLRNEMAPLSWTVDWKSISMAAVGLCGVLGGLLYGSWATDKSDIIHALDAQRERIAIDNSRLNLLEERQNRITSMTEDQEIRLRDLERLSKRAH